MPHLLVINPNTREALTTQLLTHLQAQMNAQMNAQPHPQGAASRACPLLGITAAFGDDYIASESSYVVAAHAVLEAWQRHVLVHGRPLAVLVACFGDPGVWALRETAGVPVMGLAEAAMREADALGPFAIVTGGTAWGPMLERLARGMRLGGSGHLRRVLTVPASGGQMMADPADAERQLGQACLRAIEEDAVWQAASRAERAQAASCRETAPLSSLILGGAALAGWAERLQPPPALPVIDSVAAGGRWLMQQC